MNQRIKLTTNNVIKNWAHFCVVNKLQMKKLHKLQYQGGILQFHIDVYEETDEKATYTKNILDFLRNYCV